MYHFINEATRIYCIQTLSYCTCVGMFWDETSVDWDQIRVFCVVGEL